MQKWKIRPPENTKRLKIFRNCSEYIITSVSRVVVQKFTEIGSPILGGQIGEVLVFFTYTDTQTISFISPIGHKYGPN